MERDCATDLGGCSVKGYGVWKRRISFLERLPAPRAGGRSEGQGGQKRSDCLPERLQPAAAVVCRPAPGAGRPEALAPASRSGCNQRQLLCAAPHPGQGGQKRSACLPTPLATGGSRSRSRSYRAGFT
ncbi:MAG: hypothetical protein Q4D98_10685, partial [Planctomycetia bacterium]|nr:hypothetical protein [Planctomycetia bacterium]